MDLLRLILIIWTFDLANSLLNSSGLGNNFRQKQVCKPLFPVNFLQLFWTITLKSNEHFQDWPVKDSLSMELHLVFIRKSKKILFSFFKSFQSNQRFLWKINIKHLNDFFVLFRKNRKISWTRYFLKQLQSYKIRFVSKHYITFGRNGNSLMVSIILCRSQPLVCIHELNQLISLWLNWYFMDCLCAMETWDTRLSRVFISIPGWLLQEGVASDQVIIVVIIPTFP